LCSAVAVVRFALRTRPSSQVGTRVEIEYVA
jgi:hypothetical protein